MVTAMILWITAFQALAQGSTGGSLSNSDTGLSGVYTAQAVISDHPHHVLVGHVIIVTRGSHRVRALVVQQRRDGVHRLRYAEAWSGGVALPWRVTHGQGCTHGHCRDNPVGMIFLSAALFARAEAQGLDARLVGRSGAINIAVPAALFRQASAM
jgi:hypothetical protein